jgi:hypothetical protein
MSSGPPWRLERRKPGPDFRPAGALSSGDHASDELTVGPRQFEKQCALRRAERLAGVSPVPASRQRSGEANSPASGESPAAKRGGAELQAAT